MPHGSRNPQAVTLPAACHHSWCDRQFCTSPDQGERFHRGILSSEGGTEIVGVEVVANDHGDGTSTSPQVDITFARMSDGGVLSHSVGLSPEAALRHAAAVVQAVSLALAPR
jgi:hypothetical protein